MGVKKQGERGRWERKDKKIARGRKVGRKEGGGVRMGKGVRDRVGQKRKIAERCERFDQSPIQQPFVHHH